MQRLKAWWIAFHASFHDSETILWARIKVAIGMILMASMSFDMSTIITNARWLFVYKVASIFLMADGGFSEVVRRNRATDLEGGVDAPTEPSK